MIARAEYRLIGRWRITRACLIRNTHALAALQQQVEVETEPRSDRATEASGL
jgi:hypothetical protein